MLCQADVSLKIALDEIDMSLPAGGENKAIASSDPEDVAEVTNVI